MSDVTRQSAVVFVSRSLARGAQFVAFIVLARALTPAEFGWYGIVTSSITLAVLLGSLGLRQSFAYEIGQKRLTVGEAIGTALVVWPFFAALATLVVFALVSGNAPLSAGKLLGLVAVGVAVAMLVNLLQGTNLGRGQMSAFSLLENLPRVLLMVGCLLLWLLASVTLLTSLWAQVIGYGVTAFIAIFIAVRGAGPIRPRLKRLPKLVGYGFIFAVNLFLMMLATRVSMFVIEHFHGSASAGMFFASAQIGDIFLEAATAMGMVLFSRAAQQQQQSSSVVERSVRISAWLVWVFALLAIVVVLLAPLILRILAGEAYVAAAAALQIIAIGLAPTAAAKVIYPTLAGSGRPFFGTPAIVLSVVATVALGWLLVPGLGVVGGAIGLVVGQYVLYVYYVISCHRRYGIPVRRFFLPSKADAARLFASRPRPFRRARAKSATRS